MHEDCCKQVAQLPPAGVRSVMAKSAVAMRHSSPRFMRSKRTLMVRPCPLVSFVGPFTHYRQARRSTLSIREQYRNTYSWSCAVRTMWSACSQKQFCELPTLTLLAQRPSRVHMYCIYIHRQGSLDAFRIENDSLHRDSVCETHTRGAMLML